MRTAFLSLSATIICFGRRNHLRYPLLLNPPASEFDLFRYRANHRRTCLCFLRNPTAPRLASSSKDGSVRVWSSATRRLEYALGGHSASVNVVRWGGGGIGGKGVLYTASSDRTIRIWDPNGVNVPLFLLLHPRHPFDRPGLTPAFRVNSCIH